MITLLYTEDKGKVLTQFIGKTWHVLMATFGSGKIGLSIGSQSEKFLSVTILLAGMNQFYGITCSIFIKVSNYQKQVLNQKRTKIFLYFCPSSLKWIKSKKQMKLIILDGT